MLQQLSNINFEIIFTTGYDKYAIQAIKFSALDYLLKPFTEEDLSAAINHYQQKQNKKQSAQQFDALFHNLKNFQKDSKKIALPTANGLTVFPVNEIVYCQAEINYTNFFLVSKNKILGTKTLKEYEELLDDYDFIRVHKSHLINLHHVKNYLRGEGGTVIMSNGASVKFPAEKRRISKTYWSASGRQVKTITTFSFRQKGLLIHQALKNIKSYFLMCLVLCKSLVSPYNYYTYQLPLPVFRQYLPENKLLPPPNLLCLIGVSPVYFYAVKQLKGMPKTFSRVGNKQELSTMKQRQLSYAIAITALVCCTRTVKHFHKQTGILPATVVPVSLPILLEQPIIYHWLSEQTMQ